MMTEEGENHNDNVYMLSISPAGHDNDLRPNYSITYNQRLRKRLIRVLAQQRLKHRQARGEYWEELYNDNW